MNKLMQTLPFVVSAFCCVGSFLETCAYVNVVPRNYIVLIILIFGFVNSLCLPFYIEEYSNLLYFAISDILYSRKKKQFSENEAIFIKKQKKFPPEFSNN